MYHMKAASSCVEHAVIVGGHGSIEVHVVGGYVAPTVLDVGALGNILELTDQLGHNLGNRVLLGWTKPGS